MHTELYCLIIRKHPASVSRNTRARLQDMSVSGHLRVRMLGHDQVLERDSAYNGIARRPNIE